MSEQARQPARLALVLGGGGARGLSHIPVLEALDELGVKPVTIAGASIGAAIGAAYAAGMTGREIRRHLLALLHNRSEVFRRLFAARAGAFSLFSSALGNPVLMDAEKLARLFMPDAVPDTFEELGVPLAVMTTDLHARREHVFTTGPLRIALAASMAIPGLMRPVECGPHVLVDGAAVNPLPFDCVRGQADIILAVDTSVGPGSGRGVPDPWEALFSTIQVMGHTIVTEKLRHGGPDIVIRPNVGSFRLLDFFKASAILRASEPVRQDVRTQVAGLIGGLS
jgi:NTE family protein